MLATSSRRPMIMRALTTVTSVCVSTAAILTTGIISADRAEAKTPGLKYCFVGRCHRVATLAETRALIGRDVVLKASHYDSCEKDRFNPCGLTSSGEQFYPNRPDNAASPIYPDGTKILVWHKGTKNAALLRINNAGPYWGDRKLDVSYATAERLGFRGNGVASLVTRIVRAPDPAEARYSRNRRYDPVAGYLGKFDSLDEAEEALLAIEAVSAMAAGVFAPAAASVVASAHAEHLRVEEKRRAISDKAEPLLALMDQIDATTPVALASLEAPEFIRAVDPVTRNATASYVRVASLAVVSGEFRKPEITRQQPPAATLASASADTLQTPSAAIELIKTADAGAVGTMAESIQDELLIDRIRIGTLASVLLPPSDNWPWPTLRFQLPNGLPNWADIWRNGLLG